MDTKLSPQEGIVKKESEEVMEKLREANKNLELLQKRAQSLTKEIKTTRGAV
jgi:hypothetical protein